MARRNTKDRDANGEPDQPPQDISPPPAPEQEKPVVSWRYPTSRGTTVEVAVWVRDLTLDHGQVVQTYTVTNHRAYRDQDGTWHDHNGHYRLTDLQALVYALQKAHAWIMDQRDLNCPL